MNQSEMSLLIDLVKAGDNIACERLVEENSGLIWSVVRHFLGRGVETEDLFQIGCIGFLKAIKGFDTEYGTQFSTYAVPKISGEIRRFLRDDGTIKVSRGIKEQAQKIKCARNELEQSLGREPSLSELSELTGLSPEDIAAAETATGPTHSLQYESGDDGFSLDEAIKKLPEKEQMIISLRYFHGLTQDRTSRTVGVSQVQVSRLERKAIEQLRLYLKN